MFTGIVTAIGTVAQAESLPGGSRRLTIACPWDVKDIPIGASIACNGCCLTVTGYPSAEKGFTVDISPETAKITTVHTWQKDQRVNLERGLRLGDALDGHLVAGHVDGVGKIASINRVGDAIEMIISYPESLALMLAKKGSVTIDGVSLTVNRVDNGTFSVMLIPHTLAVTTLGDLEAGDEVNLEADLVSRYVLRVLEGARIMSLDSIEALLEDAKAGRMIILVDDEGRENEGDLVLPAQHATPQAINFMATHGRGLICLALPRARVEALNLPLQPARNQSALQTAFTVSIEARSGVTTGISAQDRARTVAVAIDPAASAEDVATPGHIFPLVAKEGGVLERPGHTEAAVDIARLAGLNPSGVICEILKEDGSMARLPDLRIYAEKHGLRIGSIADLIAYRKRIGL